MLTHSFRQSQKGSLAYRCSIIDRLPQVVWHGRRLLSNKLELYKDTPFANIPPARRGKIFESIARSYEHTHSGDKIRDPVSGCRSNGARRGKAQEEYDWLRCDGISERRVEAKSASFTWDKIQNRWMLHFEHIIKCSFDELILIVHAPWGLELWEYDMQKSVGMTTQGRYTESLGCSVRLYGRQNIECLHSSWQLNISPRLWEAATFMTRLCWQHPLVTQCIPKPTPNDQAYVGTPFAALTPSQRGLILESIARQYDCLRGCASVEDPKPGVNIRGYDWLRRHAAEERRVEAKSSQVFWIESGLSWMIGFAGIKGQCFDDLVLIIYAPWGVEMWECGASKVVFFKASTAKYVRGQNLQVRGRRGERDMQISWSSAIRPRLQRLAKHVCTLSWDHAFIQRFVCSKSMADVGSDISSCTE